VILLDFLHFWEILGIFGAQIWEEVGDEQLNSDLYKPGLFEAIEDRKTRVMLKESQAKAIFMQGSY
jgi:hypothetical protein